MKKLFLSTIIAGNDLGPTAIESHIGLLGSCFTHVAEGVAARNRIPLDTLNVSLTAQFDPRAGRQGFEHTPLYPTDITMRVVISSPRDEAASSVSPQKSSKSSSTIQKE